MEKINDLLGNAFTQHNKDRKIDSKALINEALQDSEVQAFIKQNQVPKEVVLSSLNNIFQFHQQKEAAKTGSNPIPGYLPKLILHGSTIDLAYAPTKEKSKELVRQKASRHLELIDIPKRYRNVTSKDIIANEDRKAAIIAINNFLMEIQGHEYKQGLYLQGDFGVGKTYLLAWLARALAEMGKKVIFLHTPSFFANLSTHIKEQNLDEEINRISQADILILDDIGAESLSQWSRDDVLGAILQYRMDNLLPTFFSSNLSFDDLEKHFEETRNNIEPVKAKRLMQRIKFLGKEVDVGGKNLRLDD
jgi:primosomal protein dnaI